MEFKKHRLTATGRDAIFTEVWFEVATARVFECEVLGFEIYYEDAGSRKRTVQQTVRTLRAMKEKGMLQFFATAEYFERGSAEAEFLKNKYPRLTDEFTADVENLELILVKL